MRYRDVEDALRTHARDIVRHAPRGKNTAALERHIEHLVHGVVAAEADVMRAAELAAEEGTPATRQLLRTREAELETLQRKLAEFRTQQGQLTSVSVSARLKAVHDTLTAKPFDVAAANAALRDAMKKITLDPREATLEIHWHHAETPQEPVPFVSKHQRVDWETTDFDTWQQAKG